MSQNRLEHTRRRAPRSAWKPGQSGNPGGRPAQLTDVRDAARQRTVIAIGTLESICTDAKEPAAARVSAAEALLNRGWGRPAQSMDLRVGPAEHVDEPRV